MPEFVRLLRWRLDRGDAISAAAGVAWGLLAVGLMEHSRQGVVAALTAWPAIGLIVGRLSRPAAERGCLARVWVALRDLYLAVIMFAVAEWATRALGPPVLQPAFGFTLLNVILIYLFGLTFLGFVVILWPLSYITHVAVWRAVRRDSADALDASSGRGLRSA